MPVRALVVDDDPILREIAKAYLESAGFAVELAEDGEQALRAVADLRFQLIITDLVMPNVDGLELIATLRQLTPQTPVVAISSGVSGSNAGLMLRAAVAVGARATLVKPLSRATFLAAVASSLAVSEQSPDI